MLTGHLRQVRTDRRRIEESGRLWAELDKLVQTHRLPERILNALFDAASGMRIRNSTYRAVLHHAGEEIAEITASKDFRHLTDLGLPQPVGAGRGRIYAATASLAALRKSITESRDPREDSDPFAG
ncbi:hypothetical protein GCM10027589_02760 [Actinocorallia lasiicapitis]